MKVAYALFLVYKMVILCCAGSLWTSMTTGSHVLGLLGLQLFVRTPHNL